MKKITTIAAVLLLFAVAAKAQTDTATMNFLVNASIINIQEVNTGKLAAQKAADARIKAFGNRMVTDHSKAETQLIVLARRKGYNLPPNATATPPKDPMLAKLPPAKFDKLYMHMMVPGHRSAVGLFQRYAIAGKDPDIKAFAQQMLPVIKSHLTEITAINNRMK